MAENLKYIPNDDTQYQPFSVNCNKWLKCLDTQPNEPTGQNAIKVPKVVRITNKRTVINGHCFHEEKYYYNLRKGSDFK